MQIPPSKSNPRLEALLAEARARGPMTAAEIAAQRRSYVLAEAGFGSDADEAKYRAALASGDAEALAECERASRERVAAAVAILEAR